MEILKEITKDRPELDKLLSKKRLQDFKILDDDEIINALEIAAFRKQAELNRRAYQEQLLKPKEYPVYSLPQLKGYFLRTYEKRYERKFEIDQYSEKVLNQVLFYFIGDERFEGDLNKGLYLVGNPGCGKSSMMRILGFNTRQPFAFKSCIDISKTYSNDGYDAIEKYKKHLPVAKDQYNGFSEIGWCFDDLGFEEKGKHYGKETEIMTEIMEAIYNRREMLGSVHITSNISGDEIETRYGNRIRSRMREMFNMITFDENSPDRRK